MLLAAILLVAAVAVALEGRRSPWLTALSVVLAAWSGTTLPDLDMTLGLGHRSGVLHSVLPVALAAADRRWWPVAAGLGLGVGFHLAADLFPNGMRGYATVKLPGAGSIGAGNSYLWLAANAGLAMAAGAWLTAQVVATRIALATLATVALIGIAYLFRTDGGWWALLLFAGLGALALRLQRGKSGSSV